MGRFRSHYWNPTDISDPRLGQAFILMMYSDKLSVVLDNFYQLLSSDEPVAVGIALDNLSYAEAQTRHGYANHYMTYSTEALEQARKQLRQPPVTITASNGQSVVGANYASALLSMMHLGEEKDAPAINKIMSSSNDEIIIDAGLWALGTCLENTQNSYPQIISTLEKIIFDDNWEMSIRARAIGVFNHYQTPEAESLLVKILQQQLPLEISTKAARSLAFYNREKLNELRT